MCFLAADESLRPVGKTTSDGELFTFDGSGAERLRIRFPRGAERFVHLTTGRIVDGDAPSPFECILER